MDNKLGSLEPPLANAHKDGIRTLYRYVRFPRLSDKSSDAVEARRRVENLLTHSELYFPTADQFNDPFEAAPNFVIQKVMDGRPDFNALAKPLREIYAPRWGWNSDQVREAEIFLQSKIDSGLFEIEVAGLEAKWRRLYRTQYPMCCLSAERDNVLMWAYYASSHSGLCVHFDATLPPFGNAWRVNYEHAYPQLPMPMAYLDPEEVIRQSFVTKAACWQHEREYRLVDMPRYAGNSDVVVGRTLDDILNRKGPQLVALPPQFIIGVSCGALMESVELEHFARICADRTPAIPLWHSQVHKSEYKLFFELLHG